MFETVSMKIASDLRGLKEAINIILGQIKYYNPRIPEDDFMDLRLIYSELLANAIIHGNKYDSHKKVFLFIEFTTEDIISIISDEGNGFDYRPFLSSGESETDLFSETGRGIKLVRSLADELRFNNKGNEIKFVKKLAYGACPNTMSLAVSEQVH